MRIHKIVSESVVDGPGLRIVIFFQGCKRDCPGCHNPGLHDFKKGKEVSTKELIASIDRRMNPLIQGITLSGGDPMYQWNEIIDFLIYFKEYYSGKDVWMYTGATWEEIKDIMTISFVDVIVDGPYMKELHSNNVAYRGSLNQRLIKVPASVLSGRVVLYEAGEKDC